MNLPFHFGVKNGALETWKNKLFPYYFDVLILFSKLDNFYHLFPTWQSHFFSNWAISGGLTDVFSVLIVDLTFFQPDNLIFFPSNRFFSGLTDIFFILTIDHISFSNVTISLLFFFQLIELLYGLTNVSVPHLTKQVDQHLCSLYNSSPIPTWKVVD